MCWNKPPVTYFNRLVRLFLGLLLSDIPFVIICNVSFNGTLVNNETTSKLMRRCQKINYKNVMCLCMNWFLKLIQNSQMLLKCPFSPIAKPPSPGPTLRKRMFSLPSVDTTLCRFSNRPPYFPSSTLFEYTFK